MTTPIGEALKIPRQYFRCRGVRLVEGRNSGNKYAVKFSVHAQKNTPYGALRQQLHSPFSKPKALAPGRLHR